MANKVGALRRFGGWLLNHKLIVGGIAATAYVASDEDRRQVASDIGSTATEAGKAAVNIVQSGTKAINVTAKTATKATENFEQMMTHLEKNPTAAKAAGIFSALWFADKIHGMTSSLGGKWGKMAIAAIIAPMFSKMFGKFLGDKDAEVGIDKDKLDATTAATTQTSAGAPTQTVSLTAENSLSTDFSGKAHREPGMRMLARPFNREDANLSIASFNVASAAMNPATPAPTMGQAAGQ